MTVHLFGGLGMMPLGIVTDPGLPNFMQRAKAMISGLVLHGPCRDYNTGEIAAQADALPPSDIVFVVMTLLWPTTLLSSLDTPSARSIA